MFVNIISRPTQHHSGYSEIHPCFFFPFFFFFFFFFSPSLFFPSFPLCGPSTDLEARLPWFLRETFFYKIWESRRKRVFMALIAKAELGKPPLPLFHHPPTPLGEAAARLSALTVPLFVPSTL